MAGLVAMTCTATGSVRCFDELVAAPVKVVNELRRYRKWGESAEGADPTTVNHGTGIIHPRSLFNRLHTRMAVERYDEIYVDHMSDSVISVTRHCPLRHRKILMMARTVFTAAQRDSKDSAASTVSLKFDGQVTRVLFAIQPSSGLEPEPPLVRMRALALSLRTNTRG